MPLRKVLIIAVLAIISSGLFAVYFNSAVSGPDSVQYDRIAYNLVSGHGFSLDENAPYRPTMLREPGYPAFLALVYLLLGHNVLAVVFTQMVLHAITAVLAYCIARDIFGENTALLSGLTVAIFPTLANMTSYLLSETFFTFLLCMAIWAYMNTVNKRSILWSVVTGALLGALALTKAAALFLPVIFIVTIAIVVLLKNMDSKRLFKCSMVLLTVFIIVISGWFSRNKTVFNTTAFTLRGGEALWSRAEKLEDSKYVIMATACYNFSEYLGSKLFPGLSDRPERYLFKDFDRAIKIREGYIAKGVSDQDIDAIFKNEALAKISKKPLKYAAYTAVEAIKMASFTYLPVLNEPSVRNYFFELKSGAGILSAVKGMLRLIAYPILVLFCVAVCRYMYLWDRWVLLFSTIAYFNIIYSLLDAIGRYAVPLIPLYCIMAVAALLPVEVNEDSLRRRNNG